MDEMKKAMEMAKEQLRAIEQDDEMFHILASMARKYHDALTLVGFSSEQATQMVASHGLGRNG